MSTEVSKFDQTLNIGELWAKGYSAPEIAERLDIDSRVVNKAVAEYKDVMHTLATRNTNFAELVQVVMHEVDEHYRKITKEAWENKEEAGKQGMLNTVNGSLKLIADIQKARANMFQSSNLGADAQLSAQLEEAHRNQEIIVEILQEVAKKYPSAASYIRERLSDVSNEAQVIEVVSD